MLLLCSFSSAQQNTYNAQLFTQKNGLASYNIKSIEQDSYGFIWVGTQDGISFFDGTGFKLIKNNANSVAVDVKKLLYDKKRNLMWVAYTFGGIQAFDCRSHEPVITVSSSVSRYLNAGSNIRSFGFWGQDKLIIGLPHDYIIYDIVSRQETRVSNMPFRTSSEKELTLIGIARDGIYFFISNAGIFHAKEPGKEMVQLSDDPGITFKSCKETKNSIWFSTNAGLCSIDLLTNRISRETEIPEINDIVVHNQDTLILSTPAGCMLYAVPEKKFTKLEYRSAQQTSSSYNLCGFKDSQGHLWLGFSEYLLFSDLTKSPFHAYPRKKENNEVLTHLYSMFTEDGTSYYLSDLNGLAYYNSAGNIAVYIDQKSSITTCFKNQSSGYLIYNTLKGFRALNKKNNTQVPVTALLPEFRKIESRIIEKWLDLNDSIAILSGSDKKGLIKWNKKNHTIKEIEYSAQNGWENNVVNEMARLNSNEILICQDKNIGVFNVEKETITNYHLRIPESGLPASLYMSCLLTSEYYVFPAYGYGVFITDKQFNVIKLINTENGLSNNGVYCVAEDASGYLWVSSNFGLNRIDTKDFSVSGYFEDDGLHNNAFEENSFTRAGNRLIFGGINGFTSITPENIITSSKAPDIFLTNVRLFSRTADTTITCIGQTSIRIENNIGLTYIYFACNNLVNPQRNKYYYKLDNIQDNWIELGNENKITLPDLKPGKHILNIKVKSSNGVENITPLNISIYKVPKWYQTWLFKTFIGIAIFGLAFSFYRLRINQLKKEQRIRTKLASDLHDDLGSTLNSVKLYANLAIMEYPAGKYPPQIAESTQLAITSIRDMIWVLDDRKDTVEDLLLRVSNFATPLCEASSVKYIQDISNAVRAIKLSGEEKRNLYMMLKESINNSIKYASSPVITITAFLQKNKPVFIVSDEGKGFTVSTGRTGYGLKNLAIRANSIHYQLSIDSTPGNGTRIRIEKK